jgi:hypothetical protein
MAGTNSAFNATQFRQVIRETMLMGMPNAVQERATFRWDPAKSYPVADPAGNPYDLTSAPTTTTTHADVQVPVAVEFSARPAGSMDTVMGEFDTSRVIITVLDEDYEQIVGADLVIMGGNTYDIQFVGPPIGLFEVTVYQLYALARDES